MAFRDGCRRAQQRPVAPSTHSTGKGESLICLSDTPSAAELAHPAQVSTTTFIHSLGHDLQVNRPEGKMESTEEKFRSK